MVSLPTYTVAVVLAGSLTPTSLMTNHDFGMIDIFCPTIFTVISRFKWMYYLSRCRGPIDCMGYPGSYCNKNTSK